MLTVFQKFARWNVSASHFVIRNRRCTFTLTSGTYTMEVRHIVITNTGFFPQPPPDFHFVLNWSHMGLFMEMYSLQQIVAL